MRAIGIDIGGSSVKGGIVEFRQLGTPFVAEKISLSNNERTFKEVKSNVVEIIKRLRISDKTITCIGISTTGSVTENAIVRNAGLFSEYRNVCWNEIITKEISSEIKSWTINDGQAFTLAEYELMTPKPTSLANFVVGTGIGGGLVFYDKIWTGNTGTSGALGHIKIANHSDVICSCRNQGCVEAFASARAIEFLWQKSGKNDTFNNIAQFAKNGDLTAIELIMQAGKSLGIGIANVISIFEPEVIIIGGGVITALENNGDNIYFSEAVKSARENVFLRVGKSTKFVKSTTPLNGGILGAAISIEKRGFLS